MVSARSEKIILPILMADDDLDDRRFVQMALQRNGASNTFMCVEDGEKLLEYLENKGFYNDIHKFPRPALILLDLNMPKMDGREALKEIKNKNSLRNIPVVVLSTSKGEEDILECYFRGANSYITKPSNFEGLVAVMDSLKNYWFETVALP